MKKIYKGAVFALTAEILLSLCLTPTVFATEEPPGGTLSAESAVETELTEEKYGRSTATPSDAQEEGSLQPDHSDNDELSSKPTKPSETPDDGTAAETEPEEDGAIIEPVTATPSEAVEFVLPEPDTATTAEELLEWLQEHENSEGTLMLTADIFLDDLLYIKNSTKKITIDTGEFSIVAMGEVELAHFGLTVRGLGGEKGVFRAAEGGRLSLSHLTMEAEEGFAVYQEEGAGLVITQCALEESAVHYAETPFVWAWSFSLAVVGPGQTAADVLPETAEAAGVNRLGKMSREKVPVVWELAGHESSEEQRLRFNAVGSTPGFAHDSAPVCTVVYDDFPLTFLNVKAKKREGGWGESYLFIGTFSIPEDRLPITITQDYSLDGENWTVCEEKEIEDPDGTFGISFSVGTTEMQRFPDLFIRLSWDDGGTVYYSNVLRFARDNLEESEDHGGNRGGGTDIVNPPESPEPELPPITSEPEPAPPPITSEPETVPPPVTLPPAPSQPEHGGTDHETGGNGDRGDAPSGNSDSLRGDMQEPSHGMEPKPGPSINSTDNGPGQLLPVPELAPGPVSEPSLSPISQPALSGETDSSTGASSAPAPEPLESQGRVPAAADGTPDGTLPVKQPEASAVAGSVTVPPTSAKSGNISPQGPGALPIAVGLAAITASIGGAALYLHPKAWKKLLARLRNLIRR